MASTKTQPTIPAPLDGVRYTYAESVALGFITPREAKPKARKFAATTAPKVKRTDAENFVLGKTVIEVLRLMANTDTAPQGTIEALIARHDAKASKRNAA